MANTLGTTPKSPGQSGPRMSRPLPLEADAHRGDDRRCGQDRRRGDRRGTPSGVPMHGPVAAPPPSAVVATDAVPTGVSARLRADG